MPGKATNPVSHFGRQLKKERLARGWSLPELSRRTGIDAGHLSRIENGKRPPTEAIALACDAVFPERRGWFGEYYQESRTWAPPGFRNWAEYEDRAVSLRVWMPGIMHGLLQTGDYARALLETSPGATDEMLTSRLRSRMERQRRVLMRDKPPDTWFIVDQMALYRLVGSAETMTAQMQQLLSVAAMPNVTLQVLPAVAHPANASELIVTDGAAYTEHLAGGLVFTDEETPSSLLRLFNTIHSESYRASESLALIKEVGEIWTGGSPATQTPTEGPA
jgi:Domain of unknown function (DUF5753)/Helix-turn-helix domain